MESYPLQKEFANVKMTFHYSPEEWNSERIVGTWTKLIQNGNPDCLYQSAEWFDHLVKTDKTSNLILGVLENECKNPTGIIPLRLGEYALKFDVSGRILAKCFL